MTDPMGLSIEQLDALCAQWPGAARSIKWEVDLVWSVSGKSFAVMCMLGPERGRVSFRVEPERFLELSEQSGFMPAAHMAHAFWISVSEPQNFREADLSGYVRQSYDLVRAALPKKARAALDAAS